MCISFFYINRKCEANTFRFILIFNRDEFFSRRTSRAHFWKDYPQILGGRDLKDRARGTWLAARRNGKIGALLDISDKPLIDGLNSRGIFVKQYLTGGTNASEFVQQIQNDPQRFNGFNLLLFDLKSSCSPGYVHTSLNYGDSRETTVLDDGFFGISNSPLHKPLKKVVYGKREFENVVRNFNHVEKKEALVEELLRILKSDVKCYPDPVYSEIRKHKKDEALLKDLSSIFVCMKDRGYGTRTHSVLLVTHDMVGNFHEFAKTVPGDSEKDGWIHNQFVINFDH